MNFPEIVDIALPAEGVFHNLEWGSTRVSRVGFGVAPKPFQSLECVRRRAGHGRRDARATLQSPSGRPPGTASGAWAS